MSLVAWPARCVPRKATETRSPLQTASAVLYAEAPRGDLVAAKVQDLDRSFHLAEFAETQPYRNPLDLERLLGRRREAGLPG